MGLFFLEAFGICLARNRDCCLYEVLFHPPYRDKGSVLYSVGVCVFCIIEYVDGEKQ